MVDAEVVDPGIRHLRGLADEAGDAGTGHGEVHDLGGNGLHHRGRRELHRGLERVAVEDHVQVLVLGHADHDLVGDRIRGEAAGVLVRYARRKLLERRIREPAQRAHRRPAVPELHVLHAAALEHDRVDVPGDDEVVADDDRVATFLGRPAVHPVLPGAVALLEDRADQVVVRGQVVLGEEVHLEGGLRDAGEAGLVRGPRLLVEVTALAVRDEVVGEPLLRDRQVTVDELADGGLDLRKEGGLAALLFGQQDGPGRYMNVMCASVLHAPAIPARPAP